jgi:hypothetical protein
MKSNENNERQNSRENQNIHINQSTELNGLRKLKNDIQGLSNITFMKNNINENLNSGLNNSQKKLKSNTEIFQDLLIRALKL